MADNSEQWGDRGFFHGRHAAGWEDKLLVMIVQEESSRKHRASDTSVRQPRLGWLSGLALLALAVTQVAGIPSRDPMLEQTLSHAWLAAIWAGWSATVWIVAQPPVNLRRVTAAGVLLAWHCGVMEVARQQPAERYLIMFGGFAVLQVIAAVLLRLPGWRIYAARQRPSDPRIGGAPGPGQFGILSILALTALVAVVLFAVRRYGNAGGEGFVSGTAVALLMLAGIAAIGIAAATARRWGAALLLLMILAAAASASVLAWREVAQPGARGFDHYWWIYFRVESLFGLLIYGIGLCGRLDATRAVGQH